MLKDSLKSNGRIRHWAYDQQQIENIWTDNISNGDVCIFRRVRLPMWLAR